MINFDFDFNGVELYVEAEINNSEAQVINLDGECTDPGSTQSAIILSARVRNTPQSLDIDGVSLNGIDLELILEQEAIAKHMARCL